MILTEEEANTKVCPFSFSRAHQYAPDGQPIQEGGPWQCSGSHCMAWRWVTLCDGESTFLHEKGYCGLAGNPND